MVGLFYNEGRNIFFTLVSVLHIKSFSMKDVSNGIYFLFII